MQETQTWRELLGNIISDPHEKQQLAGKLGVSVLTLTRWIQGESHPRPQNLRLLLEALPHYRPLLHELIVREFGALSLRSSEVGNMLEEIPSEFYSRVLSAHATTPRVLRFWSICSLILQQALGQIDPRQLGMAITIVQCMVPTSAGQVHSLRKRVTIGSGRWRNGVEQRFSFLGAESQAGYVVSSGRSVVVQDLTRDLLYPAQRIEGEMSTAISPVMRSSEIAGCLLVSSTLPDYFSLAHCTLIQHYAELLALAFEPGDFYALTQIDLRRIPPYQVQERYFKSFRQRTSSLVKEAAQTGQSMTIVQAEQVVWQQLEEELLRLPPDTL
ncbi:MAG: helix-turn-helix domain-containing protein [Chloroflexota bacterium]|nr:helix-turn-helix domain-containing protein [Chloroflexota bacterium]